MRAKDCCTNKTGIGGKSVSVFEFDMMFLYKTMSAYHDFYSIEVPDGIVSVRNLTELFDTIFLNRNI